MTYTPRNASSPLPAAAGTSAWPNGRKSGETRGIATVVLILTTLAFLPGQAAVAQDTANDGQKASPAPALENVDLADYVGTYGPRTIALENGSLTYQREGMPTAVAMKATGVDTFTVVIPAGAQVRGPSGDQVIPAFVFGRNADGAVESLALVNPDGTVVGSDKRN